MLHQRHAAMVAGADGDAVRIEQRADVVRMAAFDIERDHGDLLGRLAHDGQTFDGLEAFRRRGEQDLLMRMRGGLDGHEVFQRDTETDGAGDIGRAGFEALRSGAESGASEVDLADHVPSELVRRHGVEQLRATPEHADAGRTEGLVPGEGKEVATQRRDIDFEVRSRLAAINQHHGTGGLGETRHLDGRIDGAEGIGDVREGDELGAGRKQALKSDEIDFAARRDGRHDDLGARALGDDLPRYDIGVVLEMGEEDFIPGLEVRPTPAFGDEVDPFGGTAHEDATASVLEPEELRDRSTGVLIGGGGLLAQEVDAAVDVGILLRVIALQGLDHRQRLLGSRGVIEVSQRTSAHGSPQNGEILTESGDVEHGHGPNVSGPGRGATGKRNQGAGGRRTALRI